MGMEKVGYEARASKRSTAPQWFNDAQSVAPSARTARAAKTSKWGGSVWTSINDIASKHRYL